MWPGIYLAQNSAKLKILQFCRNTIQLLRFGPFSLGRFLSDPPVQRSAGRWVIAHGSEERCPKDSGVSSDLIKATGSRLETVGPDGPRYSFGGARWRGGGDEETRTPDPLLAKEMLCQLSYVPRRQRKSGGRHWTRTSDLCLIRAAL